MVHFILLTYLLSLFSTGIVFGGILAWYRSLKRLNSFYPFLYVYLNLSLFILLGIVRYYCHHFQVFSAINEGVFTLMRIAYASFIFTIPNFLLSTLKIPILSKIRKCTFLISIVVVLYRLFPFHMIVNTEQSLALIRFGYDMTSIGVFAGIIGSLATVVYFRHHLVNKVFKKILLFILSYLVLFLPFAFLDVLFAGGYHYGRTFLVLKTFQAIDMVFLPLFFLGFNLIIMINILWYRPFANSDTPSKLDIESLSKRELEVFKLLKSGLSNDQISQKLFITQSTTKFHIKNIYSKLGCKNRLELIKLA